MKAVSVIAALVALGLSTACTTTGEPALVTRYHGGQPIASGAISVEPFASVGGQPAAPGPEFDLYAGAVREGLARQGWTIVPPGTRAAQVALVSVERDEFTQRVDGPVSLGLGAGTGGYSSGVGGGMGFKLGGGRRPFATTTLNVRIKQAADDRVLWEGRATATTREDRPEASGPALARRLADGLFEGFPGESGRTIRIP